MMEVTVPEERWAPSPAIYPASAGASGDGRAAGRMAMVRAEAPLSEVMQYQSQLKSVTGGQGSFVMELSHYEPVPPQVQQQIVAAYRPKAEEE